MVVLDQLIVALAALSWGRTLMAGGFVAAIYFFGFFNDAGSIRAASDRSRKEIQDIESQLKSTRDAIAHADRFEQEVKMTVDQFSKISEYMPEKLSTAELTTFLAEISSKAGMRLLKTQPRPGSDKTSYYETSKLGFSLEGTYSQVVTFLSFISQAPRFLTFDRIEITPVAGSDPEAPKLVFNAVVVGYRYLPPKPEATPVKAGGADAKR